MRQYRVTNHFLMTVSTVLAHNIFSAARKALRGNIHIEPTTQDKSYAIAFRDGEIIGEIEAA